MKVVSAPRFADPSHTTRIHRRIDAILFLIIIAIVVFIARSSAHATNLWWDSNGTATAGAGATPNGTWGTSNFWNTSSSGLGGTLQSTTTAADNVFFSAGTDAVNAFTVSLPNNTAVSANSITAEEGSPAISMSSSSGSTVNIGAGGLTVNNSAGFTFTGSKLTVNIANAQSWVNNGSGTVNVTSNNFTIGNSLTLNGGSFTFNTTVATANSGGITVSAGNLFANSTITGTTATGVVTVNGTGTLGGTGTITGPGLAASSTVTVSGGKINAGPSGTAGTAGAIGTLNITNANPATTTALTLTGSSIFSADMTNVTGNADLVNITGVVNLGTTSTLQLNITNGTTFTAGQAYTLIANDASDAIIGTFANAPVSGGGYFINGYGFVVNYAGGTGNDLVLTAVPEPSTWLAAALALAAIGYIQRRKLAPALKRVSFHKS